ncbi:hypothetical protein ACI799_01490 [Blastococcus sp. SYSU DS0753]
MLLSSYVQPLGPNQVIHGIPITPVRIQLLDSCELRILPMPANTADLLRAIHGTLLYGFTGVSLGSVPTSYIGISEGVSGSRVVQSLKQRTPYMESAGLALLSRPLPYRLDMLRVLEAATLKRSTMRTRPLNTQSNAREAYRRLTPPERTLADALGQQISDAITVYALGGAHATAPCHYPNARDFAAALIHRLGGRAVDTAQVVSMLLAAGAPLTAKEKLFVTRRDLLIREAETGNPRIGHFKVEDLAVYFPASVTPQQARADYAAQRNGRRRRSRLPIPAPATTTWCRCPYCSPITAFSTCSSPTPASVLKTA